MFCFGAIIEKEKYNCHLMKKTKKQATTHLAKHQAGAMLFLSGALVYYIVAQGLMVKTEYFPTTIFAPVASGINAQEEELASDYQAEFGEVALGATLNTNKRIDDPRNSFSQNTETIFLSVELIYPSKGTEIQGQFYYYGQQDSDPVLLSDSSVTLADRSQDVVYFTLPRPGNQWQLKGKFKAMIILPSSGTKQEIDFTIN